MDGGEIFVNCLIAAFIISSVALLFLPKRGPLYAYRNWYRLQAAIIAGVVVVVLFGSILALGFYPGDLSDMTLDIAFLIALLLIPIFMIIYSYRYMMPPTQRRRWLRKNYPGVARAVERYRRAGEKAEPLKPKLIINGKTYFAVEYHDQKEPEGIGGYVLLDHQGRPVFDEQLFRKAMQCRTLAIHTIDYTYHKERLGAAISAERAVKGLQRFFRMLKTQKRRWEAEGAEMAGAWRKIVGAEKIALEVLEASNAVGMLEADWAAEHGLSRLTEVRHEDVLALDEEWHRIREPILRRAVSSLDGVPEAADRLVGKLEEERSWPNRDDLKEGLLGLVDLTNLAREILAENGTYAYTTEHQLRKWRERMAWAAEVEGGSVEEKWVTAE
jgi:hypothetical protein